MNVRSEEYVNISLKKLTTFIVFFLTGGAIFFLVLCSLFGLTIANQKSQLNDLHTLALSQGLVIQNMSALFDKQQIILNKLSFISISADKAASKANDAVYAAQTAVKNSDSDKTVVRLVKIPGSVQIPVQTKSVILKVKQHSFAHATISKNIVRQAPKATPTPTPCNRIHALFSKC